MEQLGFKPALMWDASVTGHGDLTPLCHDTDAELFVRSCFFSLLLGAPWASLLAPSYFLPLKRGWKHQGGKGGVCSRVLVVCVPVGPALSPVAQCLKPCRSQWVLVG